MRRLMLLGLAAVAVLGMDRPVKAAPLVQVGQNVQYAMTSNANEAAMVTYVQPNGETVALIIFTGVTAGTMHAYPVNHDGNPAGTRLPGTWHFLSEQ